MAERRMFSKRLINSARFLKMPVSTQCLYFHLGLQADDDGIVEAYSVMNLVGATEDDLKVLVSKGFVYVLNEDLVTYITDWNENNKIRADRKVDSIYKDLLLQVLPDVQILEKRERADVKKKIVEIGQPLDVHRTTNGQPMDGIGKDSIGKYSINIKESNTNVLPKKKTNYQEIIDKYNSICKSLPKVMKLSDSRRKAINARLDKFSLEEIISVFEKAEQSNFLKGANNRNWKADFDWIMSDRNMAKILEGKYDNCNALKDNSATVTSSNTVTDRNTYTPKTTNRFNNFEQRQYSDDELDELERKLLSR